MMKTYFEERSAPLRLDIRSTQKAIQLVKRNFEQYLETFLGLEKIEAPLFLSKESGLNDALTGVEKAVSFQIPFLSDEQAEVVHSLAKWKRMVLDTYGYHPGEGIYTDMRAIRAEEELDPIHSLYVDQRDWEKIITQEQRTLNTLKATITKIYQALLVTEELLTKSFPQLKPFLAKELYFISAQDLADRYPELTAKERETAICREYGSVFVMQIGMPLSSGLPHEKRAPDYDDWLLNGDLLVYYPPLKQAVELSSMGIRVDAERLLHQRALRHPDKKLDAPYHQMIVDEVLPYTIGGGIGQSRVVMLLLHKLHIGEVQVSLRGKEIETGSASQGIPLL